MSNAHLQNNVVLEPEFGSASSRLIVKCCIQWINIRFSEVINIDINPKLKDEYNAFCNLLEGSKVALISENDGWEIEKNARLIEMVATDHLRNVLPDDMFEMYGGVVVTCDRKCGIAEIGFAPMGPVPGYEMMPPCTMCIIEGPKLIADTKDNGSLVGPLTIDVLPFLKTLLGGFSFPRYEAYINKCTATRSGDATVIANKATVIRKRYDEVAHLAKIESEISNNIAPEGESHKVALKLAIALHFLVRTHYDSDAYSVMKVTFNEKGGTPILDFSHLFDISMDLDLTYIQRILNPLVQHGIKIKVSGDKGKILFTTNGQDDPDNEKYKELVRTTKLPDETSLNYIFDNFVAPVVGDDEIKAVAARINALNDNATV